MQWGARLHVLAFVGVHGRKRAQACCGGVRCFRAAHAGAPRVGAPAIRLSREPSQLRKELGTKRGDIKLP